MTKTKPLGSLDYFKVVAALLVVAIHTSPLTSFHAEVDFIFTRIMARMAVPFFLNGNRIFSSSTVPIWENQWITALWFILYEKL